jgi:WD40 repeat protein
VAFDPTGERVITGAWDQSLRIWDARMGKLIGRPLLRTGAVWFAAFDPSGTRVITGYWDQSVRIWDARTSEPVGKILEHSEPVRAAAFDPKGERVVTASDNTAQIWNARTGSRLASYCNTLAESSLSTLTLRVST